MKTYQQSCTITLSNGKQNLMLGIFQKRPFVTAKMIKDGVKYHDIIWDPAREVVCQRRKKC